MYINLAALPNNYRRRLFAYLPGGRRHGDKVEAGKLAGIKHAKIIDSNF